MCETFPGDIILTPQLLSQATGQVQWPETRDARDLLQEVLIAWHGMGIHWG